MAKGYIGKISAIVTVNTADAERAFNKSAADAERFGQNLRKTVDRATRDAGKSFDNIYTPFQRLLRGLRASASENFNLGVKGPSAQELKKVEQLALAARQLADPLGAAAKQLDTFSFAVQRQFSPALVKAQAETERLRAIINDGGTVGRGEFEALAKQINGVTASMNRLGQAASLTKRVLTDQDGASLTFVRPQAVDAVSRLASAQSGLSGLPASVRGSEEVIGLIRQGERAAVSLEKVQARIERLRSEGLSIRFSEAGLEATIRRINEIEQQTRRIVDEQERVNAATRAREATLARQIADNDRLITQERELAAARRRSADEFAEARRNSVRDASAALTGRVQQATPTEEVFAGLPEQARRARVAVANAFRAPEADDLRNRLRQINAELEDIASEEARLSATDPLRERIQDWAELTARIETASDRLRAVEGLARRASASFTPQSLNPEVTIDVDVSQLEASGDRIRAAFIDRIRAIDTAWDQAVRGLVGTTDELDQRFFGLLRTIESLDLADRVELDPLIAEYRQAVAAGEGYAETLQRLLTLQGRFNDIRSRGNAPGAPGVALPPGFRGQSDAGLGPAINDPQRQLDALRSSIVSAKSQIDQLPAALRQQFIPAITTAEAEFRRLAAAPNQSVVAIDVARQRLIALTREANQASQALNFRRSFGSRDAIVSSLQVQQLRGYTAQIQILEGELASVTGFARGPAVAAIARLGTVISEQMRRGTIDTQAARQEVQRLTQDAVRATAAARGISAGALGRTVARAGDVGRQGFANLSLGIQQAAFAFEDFFSVTGGLDQRIRAAGNNISQLGFILGGTTGLIIGISTAIGAQLVAAIIKWTGATEDAERRQRELKDALESTNGALERQRQLAEQLRNTYRELAKSIAEAGAPEAFRDERQRREQIAAVQREQEDRRRAGIEAVSPQIAQRRGQIAEIDRQLETEQNAAARQRLIERRNAADAAIRREIDDVEQRAAENARVAVERNAGIDGALRDQRQRRDAVRGDIGVAARRGNEAEVNRLSRELAVIDTTIARLRDGAARLAAERGQGIIGSVNRAQASIENVPGIRQLDAILGSVRVELERYQRQVAEGTITFQEFTNQEQRLALIAQNAERAGVQLAAFSDALESAAGSLARAVEQELRGRVDTQRRQANAAEAEFGTNDPRAQLARRQQLQSEQIRRQATREREGIDAEIARRRRNFEIEAIAGRAGGEANRIGGRLREIETALSRGPRNREEAREQDRMRLEANGLRRQLGEIFSDTPDGRQLNRRGDLADIRAQQGIQGQEAVRRGFEASITPAQRAGEQLGRTIGDLKAALDDGAITVQQYNEAVKRTTEEQSRAIAPAIFALADQVQNAVLQGPSRAALNVADVSTAEGSRELNRLIRGDDAALQQANLQELQKQSELLRGLLSEAQKQAAPKVIDMK